MKSAVKKLNNHSGATMILALVFFLLCSVIASILLVSSSASTGRLSEIAKNDARYYAVNSAAELLRDGLEDKPVTVKLIKNTVTTTVTPYTVNAQGETEKGTPVSTPDEDYSVMFSSEGFSECTAVRETSLLTDFALDLAVGPGIINANSAWTFTGLASAQTRELEFTHTAADLSNELKTELKVQVSAVLETDGQLKLTVTNSSEGTGSYSLILSFSPEISRETYSDTVQGNPSVVKNSDTSFTETVVSERTETKIVTVSWKLTGVEGVST